MTDAISEALGRRLEIADVFSSDGTFREPSGCALCGCCGCMPDHAFDAKGGLKTPFKRQLPGEWAYAGGSAPEAPAAAQFRPN